MRYATITKVILDGHQTILPLITFFNNERISNKKTNFQKERKIKLIFRAEINLNIHQGMTTVIPSFAYNIHAYDMFLNYIHVDSEK